MHYILTEKPLISQVFTRVLSWNSCRF